MKLADIPEHMQKRIELIEFSTEIGGRDQIVHITFYTEPAPAYWDQTWRPHQGPWCEASPNMVLQ